MCIKKESVAHRYDYFVIFFHERFVRFKYFKVLGRMDKGL